MLTYPTKAKIDYHTKSDEHPNRKSPALLKQEGGDDTLARARARVFAYLILLTWHNLT